MARKMIQRRPESACSQVPVCNTLVPFQTLLIKMIIAKVGMLSLPSVDAVAVVVVDGMAAAEKEELFDSDPVAHLRTEVFVSGAIDNLASSCLSLPYSQVKVSPEPSLDRMRGIAAARDMLATES